MNADDLEARWRRLYWHCRRGMQELDILLLRYVKSCESSLPADRWRELALIEQFLGLQDPELQRYLLAGERPENPAWAALAERIRATPRVL